MGRRQGEHMNGRRIVGLLLVMIGLVVLLWGGVFWTDRDTIIDAGEIELSTESREGVSVPPIVGGAVLAAGILLLVIPARRRV